MFPSSSFVRVFFGILWILTSSVLRGVSAERLPNIILIVADDLGARDLACYGSSFYQTPHLDRMAKEGIRFTQAYAACTVCSPSRAALMTGKSPARLHLTDFIPGRNLMSDQKLRRPDFEQQLPLGETTLAETLRAKGYRTGCFGKWHLGGKGFEAIDQGFESSTPDAAGLRRVDPFPAGAPVPRGFVAPNPGEELTSLLTRSAVSFIEQHRQEPFFLYFPEVAVHIPLYGTEDRIRKFQALPKKNGASQTNVVYAAMLEALDESVGAVLQKIRDLGLEGNTLVLFTSDNGGLSVSEGPMTPATSNAPFRAGKGHCYEGGLRIPLIAWWPGVIEAGKTCDTPVISMDVHDTLAEIGGAEPGSAGDGHSFAAFLRHPSNFPAYPLFWHYPHYSNQGGKPAGAIRSGDFKLIEFYESGHLELYDLRYDPGETRSLADLMPERANAMAQQLNEWRKSVGAQMPTPNKDYVRVPLRSSPDGTIVFPAHEVTVHGKNVRYEPPAHKNTIGYWTLVEDWVDWEFTLEEGDYSVEILQGCGKGSGGSEVEIQVGDERLKFKVWDTGHFQNFVRRTLGTVHLAAGTHQLAIRPQHKPGGAVMDVREMLLRPVPK